MNPTLRNVLLLCGYYSFQVLIFYILFSSFEWFNPSSLLNWDAEHYYKIVVEGYDQTRTAFFPMFPLFWKYSDLSVLAISVFNALVFLISLSWLCRLYSYSWKQVLLIASIPSFIFFFLPYTESMFFAGSTFLLTGYKKKNYLLVFAGLLIASFARPAASVFLPAIILVEWLTRDDTLSAVKNIALSTIALAIGLFAAFAVHYAYTGEWFGFFDVQKNVWDNKLQLPSLPLRSWAGLKITILDGTALLVGFLSLWQIVKWLLPNYKSMRISQERSLLFSLFYLLGIALLVLLYRDGSLFSLNRFSFASAFFVVGVGYYSNQKFTNKSLLWIGFVTIWWLLFFSFVHIATFLKYLAVTAFLGVSILAVHQNKSISRIAFPALFIGLSLLQLYFYFRFLSNQWVG